MNKAKIKKTYKPMGLKIGSEIEHLIINDDNSPLDITICDKFSDILNAKKMDHSREIYSGVFETKTKAYRPSHLMQMFNERAKHSKLIYETAEELGAKTSELPFDPDLTLDEAMEYNIKHPRADNLLSHLKSIGEDKIIEHCVMTTGIHVSIGFDDLDEALDIIKISSMLTPLLTLLMENNIGRDQGVVFKGNPTANKRHSQKERTDIQEYFYSSNTGEELINNHIQHILNTPAMMYMDGNEEVQISKNPHNTSLKKLSKTQEITEDNFFLVEKMQYNDVKIASLKCKDDNVIGHRVELRMSDNGVHQHDSMVLIALMIASKKGRIMIREVLKDFGYESGNPELYNTVCADLSKAISHDGKHLSQIMSNGETFSSMAKEFGNGLQSFISEDYPEYLEKALPILKICNTGRSQASDNIRKKPLSQSRKTSLM